MMRNILICPSERSGVELLSRAKPLVTIPLLGQSLLEYWLSSLSSSGSTEVLILAHDRAEQVEALVGRGERWGLVVQVLPESRELTPAQASLKYTQDPKLQSVAGNIACLDYFPGLEQFPIFGSYADFLSGLCRWMSKANTPDRVGMRKLHDGIWASTRAHVSRHAKLNAPCWIGHYASIGADSVIGPRAIIEDEVLIEPGAEIVNSRIGSGTFVGQLARITDSLALGETLINCRTGSILQIADPFLLCALFQPRQNAPHGWFVRLAELLSRGKEDPSVLWKHLVLNKES
jgi:NDP-sugar pyrophosphorylase family protein